MKKRFKGFTLIECLIALAILGVASLTMAQIYAGVARRNRNNQLLNTSLSNQMAYVERYTSSETVPIYYGGGTTSSPDPQAASGHQPPHKVQSKNSGKTGFVKITRIDTSKTGAASRDKNQVYSFPVDTYILLSRDNNDNSSGNTNFAAQYDDYFTNSSGKDDNNNLRYKYLTSHAN